MSLLMRGRIKDLGFSRFLTLQKRIRTVLLRTTVSDRTSLYTDTHEACRATDPQECGKDVYVLTQTFGLLGACVTGFQNLIPNTILQRGRHPNTIPKPLSYLLRTCHDGPSGIGGAGTGRDDDNDTSWIATRTGLLDNPH